MTNPISDDMYLRIKAARAIHKILQREKKVYLKELHMRTAVGLDTAAFKSLIEGLECCSLKEGRLGAAMVVFNESPSGSVAL